MGIDQLTRSLRSWYAQAVNGLYLAEHEREIGSLQKAVGRNLMVIGEM